MPGKSILAMLGGKKEATDLGPAALGEEEAAESEGDEVAETAGADAMSAMMDALDARDPQGAFEALKDAIAAAGG